MVVNVLLPYLQFESTNEELRVFARTEAAGLVF